MLLLGFGDFRKHGLWIERTEIARAKDFIMRRAKRMSMGFVCDYFNLTFMHKKGYILRTFFISSALILHLERK